MYSLPKYNWHDNYLSIFWLKYISIKNKGLLLAHFCNMQHMNAFLSVLSFFLPLLNNG